MKAHTESALCFTEDAPLQLESGGTLGPIRLAYQTYGRLSAQKDNAILICHALSGDAHAAFESKETPGEIGWWDTVIGPGKAIDTNRYYVICSNVIGSCHGSTGPAERNPITQEPYGLSFPVITISDMVSAQKRLLEILKVSKLKLVVGGSMGGMQALQWTIQYPGIVEKCIPIAATASLSPQALAFDAVGRNAITSDSHWNSGKYHGKEKPKKGLAIARMIGHITYLSDESMVLKFGRRLQQRADYGYDLETEFQVESYLHYQGNKFGDLFDANSYLYLTKAIDYFDLKKKYGSLENAFQTVTTKFLLIGIHSDWLYPAKQSREIALSLMKLQKNVAFCELNSPYGHDAFLLENEEMSTLIRNFLDGNSHET